MLMEKKRSSASVLSKKVVETQHLTASSVSVLQIQHQEHLNLIHNYVLQFSIFLLKGQTAGHCAHSRNVNWSAAALRAGAV